MNLLGLAARNLRRRPLRTALTIAGVALAVASALALVSLSSSIERSTQQGLDEFGSDLVVSQKGAPDLFGGFLPEDLDQRLKQIRGVTRVAGELFLFAPSERDRQVLVSGWSEQSHYWQNAPLREGRPPAPGERGVALLGDAVAELLGKALNDEIELLGVRFRVIGITKYGSMVNRGLVIVPLPDLQEATYRKGQVTVFYVTLARGALQEEVRREIAALGRLSISQTGEVLQNDRNFALLKAISFSISVIALAMGVLNVLNTLLMMTQERTREFGILAAIGWRDSRIMGSVVLEGQIICAFGCLFGTALGFAASFLFRQSPGIGEYIDFQPSVGLIVATVLAAVALCLVGSIYPAWRAISVPPAQALQRA